MKLVCPLLTPLLNIGMLLPVPWLVSASVFVFTHLIQSRQWFNHAASKTSLYAIPGDQSYLKEVGIIYLRWVITVPRCLNPYMCSGVSGLYRGIASNIASSAPISALYTFTYESVKGALLPVFPKVSFTHVLLLACWVDCQSSYI